jgi:hypothetical protein
MFKQKPKTLITIRRVLLLAILAIVIVASFGMVFGRSETATAAASSTINFQARLLTAAGSVVPDGLYNVEFKLYNAATSSGSSQGSCSGDAACVWVETRTASNRVRVVNGYLTVNLGSVSAFGSINWDQEHWLGMNVGGTTGPSWDGEMTPRLKLTAVPHAFTAGKLVGGSGSNTTTLNTGTPSGNNTISLPAESGTLCIQGSVNCGFAVDTGGTGYIQNQFSGVQSSSQFWISGTGRAATSLQAPLIDAASTGTLAIGTTIATAIDLNQNTTIASGKTLTVTSGATSLTGASTGDALTVSNSTSTGNILVLKDNSTTVMTVADGGGVTFTSSVNSSTALQVQNSAGGNVLSVNTTGSGATLSLGRSGASGHLGAVISQVYQGSSSASQGFTFSGGVAAGASVVGSLTLSASATTTVTITDTAGNTYSVDASVASGSVTTSYIFSSNITNAITAGDTLTIQLGSGTGRWLVTANAFGNLLTPILDKTSTNTSSNTSMTTGTSAATTTANELVFATFGFGSGRTFTPGAGYTGITQLETTAGSNDRSVGSEWKYVTSIGTQEGTASISSSGVYSAALATYRATNPSLGGSAGSIQFSDGTSGNNFVTLGTETLTTGRTILLPNESGTLCIQGSDACGSGVQRVANIYKTNNSGNLTGSFAAVDFNAQKRVDDDFSHSTSTNSSEVTILDDGWYKVSYYIGVNNISGTNRSDSVAKLQYHNGSTWVDVAGTEGWMYNRMPSEGMTNAAASAWQEFTAGQKVRLVVAQSSGTDTLQVAANTTGLLIEGVASATDPATLQQAYGGSTGGTTPEIKLDTTRGGLDIQDADTTIGASESLFAVRASNAGGLGNAMFQIQGNGAALFKNASNSTTAFGIQNAAGSTLFNVDTSNGRVGVGGAASFSKFEVIGGDAAIYNNGANPRLVLGDSTSAGQNGYLQWDSTNDYFRIESVGTNGVKINDNYVAIGNIFPSQPLMVGNGSTLLFQVNTTGDVLAKTSTNSATAFQVQNASSSSVLTVNTSTSGVTVNGALTQSGGAISLTGSTTSSISTASGTLTLQSVDANNNIVINGGSNSMTLNTGAAGTITVGSSNTTTVNIGAQTNNARTVNIGYPSAGSQAQTVNIGATAGTGAVTMRSGTGGTTLISTGSTVVRTQTDSITGFQIQDSTSSPIFAVDTLNNRVGINLQTSDPAVTLDVNGSIQQTGMETSDTVGTFANQWTKLGSCTITAQYQQCMTTLNLIGGANGNTAGNGRATVSARVKQQNALGGAPITNLTLNGTAEVLTKDDFKMVTTTNTGSSTVVELWMRITTSFEHYNYTPVMNSGWNSSTVAAPWVWSPQNGFSASLPGGTQTSAIFSNSYANTLTVQSATNVTNALQVQNAAGSSLFNVSTSSNQVSVGSTAQTVDLNMTGEISWGASLETPQGFEGATFVPTSPGTWSTGGTAGWSRTTASAQSGSASAVSANVGDSQATWLDLNYTFAVDGTFSFYWKVSSEASWDYLMFCIDDDANCALGDSGVYTEISGETNWAKVSVPVTAGAHSFRWTYEKDGGVTDGSDLGWIDNVQFNGGGSSGVLRGGTLSFIASDTISFQTTNNANALTVDSNGRVGINTSAPTEALSVEGNFNVRNTGALTKAYRFRTTGGSLDFEGGGANLYLSAWTNADYTGTQYTALILYNSQSRMDVKSGYTYFNPDSDSTSTIDVATPATGLQNLIRFVQSGTVQGSITVNGATVAYNAFTGSHYAWTDSAIERGMLVSMTGDNKRRDTSDFTSEPFYGIAKTSQPNDPKVLGSYFGRGAGAWSFDNPDQVMSVGNGDMWVSDEGGDIQPGDYLISSSLAGHAMKDGGQFAESHIVARASDSVRWDDETQVVDGKKVKKISVLFTQFTRLNAAGLAMGMANGGIVSNDVTFNGLVLFNNAVRFKSDASFEGLIKVSDNTAGTIKIPAGQTSATVTFNKAYGKPPKVTTGISEFVDVVVDSKTNNGFTVRIPAPRGTDTYIDWTAFETP